MSLRDRFDSTSEALKVRHRSIFLAMQQANRAWVGGVTEAFKVQGVSPTGALAAFAPDEYNKAPGLLMFLDHIEYIKPRRVVHEIAALADCITVPAITSRKAMPSRRAAADDLAARLRKVVDELDEAAGSPTLSRSQGIQADLLALIDAAHVMYLKLNMPVQDVRIAPTNPRPPLEKDGARAVHPASSTEPDRIGDAIHPNQMQGAPMPDLHKGTEELDRRVGSGIQSN
jgi:hypothetical protein